MCVCVSVCVSVYTITKTNGSIHLKLEHIVVYKKAWTSSTLGIVQSRSRSRRDFEIFLHLTQYNVKSFISGLAHVTEL